MLRKNTVIYIILSALLVCLLLTGCDSGSGKNSDTTTGELVTTTALPTDTTTPADTTTAQPSSDTTTAEASDTTLPWSGGDGTIVLPRVNF